MVKRFFIACAALLFASCAQAQITETFGTYIGGLTNTNAVSNADALYVLQGGVSKRASPGVISGAAGTPTGSIMWNNSGLLAGFGNWNGTSTVAFGNGGVAQSLRVYNTVDSLATPVNLEAGIFDWQTTTNVLTIGTIAGGTGVVRPFQFVSGGTPVGDYLVTRAALWNFSVNTGVSGGIDQSYQLAITNKRTTSGVQTGIALYNPNATNGDDRSWAISTNYTLHGSLDFVRSSSSSGVPDGTFAYLTINPHANADSGIIATSAASLYMYNVLDNIGNPINYERSIFDWQSTANVLTIGTQKGGTGSARNMAFITGGIEAARIDTGGKVIFGGTSARDGAGNFVELVSGTGTTVGTGASLGLAIIAFSAANNQGNLIFDFSGSDTVGTQVAATSGQALGNIEFRGSDSTGFSRSASISANADANFTSSSSPGRLSFATTPSGSENLVERLRIDNAGRIMIGGTASQVLGGNNIEFQIHGTSFAGSTSGNVRWQNNTASPSIYMAKSRGASIGTHAAVTNGDDLGFIVFLGDDGTNFPEAAYISSDVDGSVSAGSVPTRVAIWTTPGGGTSPSERFRIDNKGHVNYTTSAPTASACAGFALSTGSSDTAGRVTFTSATSCAISFANTFTNAPFCSVIPGSAASTVTITTSTTVLTATFGTAQTAMFYQCFGN